MQGGIFYHSYLHPLPLIPSPLVNLIPRYVSSITCWLFPSNGNRNVIILYLTFSSDGRRWTCVDKIMTTMSLMHRVGLDLHQLEAFSRLSDSGEDAKVKGTRKVGGVIKRKRKVERACNHFFYDPLPSTFGTFEIIRFRLSNC